MPNADRVLAIKSLAAKLIDRYPGEFPQDWQHIRIELYARGPKREGKIAVETKEAEL